MKYSILVLIFAFGYILAQGASEEKCTDQGNQEDCCNISGCVYLNCTDNLACLNATSVTTENCKENVTDSRCTGNDTTATPPTAGPNSTGSATISPTTTLEPNATTGEPGTQTPAPGTTEETPDCSKGQRFDAASFVGGIVLCGGIVIIVFFACKFYKSRSERTYHQF